MPLLNLCTRKHPPALAFLQVEPQLSRTSSNLLTFLKCASGVPHLPVSDPPHVPYLQMAKRLGYIAQQEGLHIADNALEELAERVNGDMRMAINQLQVGRQRSSSILSPLKGISAVSFPNK
jgi:DNA polymerase III delta subunit